MKHNDDYCSDGIGLWVVLPTSVMTSSPIVIAKTSVLEIPILESKLKDLSGVEF